MSLVDSPGERAHPPLSPDSRRADAMRWMAGLHDELTSCFGRLDGGGTFVEDRWERPGGGGGVARVMTEGATFEKAGIHRSAVMGGPPAHVAQRLGAAEATACATHSFSADLSLVAHPRSPRIPTVHFTVRYVELTDADGQVTDRWYGGATDLTPFYAHEADAAQFHRALRAMCDRHHEGFYPAFKQRCDEYFVNTHRDNEARGVGGIYFDHLRPSDDSGLTEAQILAFLTDVGRTVREVYEPIVERRRNEVYTATEREFQLVRRGRYIEFHLVHDRSTTLGLQTNARMESVLMNLPPLAMWPFAPRYAADSMEARLIAMLTPRDWATHSPGAQ